MKLLIANVKFTDNNLNRLAIKRFNDDWTYDIHITRGLDGNAVFSSEDPRCFAKSLKKLFKKIDRLELIDCKEGQKQEIMMDEEFKEDSDAMTYGEQMMRDEEPGPHNNWNLPF